MDKKICLLIKKRNEKGMELLINDVYLRIWNNIASFDEKKNILKNWIAAIAKYKAIDYKRRYLKTLEHIDISELEIESDFTIEKEALKNELEYETEEILKGLNLLDKQLFIKLFIKEESIKEVSEEFNIKPSVVYNRVSRGKSKLRSLLLKHKEG